MEQEAPAQESSSVLIEMSGIAVANAQRPGVAVVEDVDWRLEQGDYWVIAGLADSGKSAFLSTAAGLNPPVRGQQRLFGNDPVRLSDEELVALRRRIGLVFENGGRLFSHLTVAENVALPFNYHHNESVVSLTEQVERLLQATGLREISHNTPATIRRTWRQRVALARALILKPDVLLLDNPLAGMDVPETRWWRETLSGLAGGHAAMGGKPVTLAVTCDDLRPFLDQGKQFGLLRRKHFVRLGGREEVRRAQEPILRELLPEQFEMR